MVGIACMASHRTDSEPAQALEAAPWGTRFSSAGRGTTGLGDLPALYFGWASHFPSSNKDVPDAGQASTVPSAEDLVNSIPAALQGDCVIAARGALVVPLNALRAKLVLDGPGGLHTALDAERLLIPTEWREAAKT